MEQFAVVLSYEICRCRNENFGNTKYMCKFVRVSCCLVFYNIRLPTYVVVELKMTPNQTPIHGTTKLLHLCSR